MREGFVTFVQGILVRVKCRIKFSPEIFLIRFLGQKMPFLRTFSLTSDDSCFTSEI